MKTIIVANQKGGIGKTTTATAVASILNAKGYKTLLIDADQQGNSSDTYRAAIEGSATLFDVLLDEERISLEEAIQHTESGDIVASDPLLRKADEILNGDPEGLYRFQDALDQLKGYDFVIVDTAPSLNSILYNCLVAADDVLIPRVEWGCGMSNINITNGLCPGGRVRMERLSRLALTNRADPELLVTHRFKGLEKIEDALYLMKDKPKDLIKPIVKID